MVEVESKPMTTVRPRPRFELGFDDRPDEVMQRLRDRLKDCPNCTGASVGNHAELFVPESEQHLWSPWLSVTAEAGAEDRTTLRGRFGPHPTVWTLYMFLSFALGFALLVFSSWGYAQWVMEITPWALYAVPVLVVLGALLYGVSLVGQRLGADQMNDLRSSLEALVSPKVQG